MEKWQELPERPIWVESGHSAVGQTTFDRQNNLLYLKI
jgi:hypothetical protein